MSQSSLTYSDTAAVEMSVYKASSQSRKTNWVLLIGAVSIWVFAAWTIVTIIPDGIELGEVVSLVLMAGLIVVAPFLMWNIAEEMSASYTVSDGGLSYQSLGTRINCTWPQVEGITDRSTDSFFGGDSSFVKLSSDCKPVGTSLAAYFTAGSWSR